MTKISLNTDERIIILKDIENNLALHHVFGDSDYIARQLVIVYERMLAKVSDSFYEASCLLKLIHERDLKETFPIICNTVVRCAVQHSYGNLQTGADFGFSPKDCKNIFASAAALLSSSTSSIPFEHGSAPLLKLGNINSYTHIWSEDYPDEVFGWAYRKLVDDEYGSSLVTPSRMDYDNLRKGVALLEKLAPSLARSALSHVHIIGLFDDVGYWRGKASSSQYRIGGTVFLNRGLLSSPWWVAEHLLHEALHQKLYDFRRGHKLLILSYDEEGGPLVWSPWNSEGLKQSNLWNVHRTFAAFHVYVHMSLLIQLAELNQADLVGEYGLKQDMLSSDKAIDRAFYLGYKLKQECWSHIDDAGKKFVDWMLSALQWISPKESPPPGAFVHHLLELYVKEASELRNALTMDGYQEICLQNQLRHLALSEIKSFHELSGSIGILSKNSPMFGDLDQIAKTAFSELSAGRAFFEVRNLIANYIRNASPNKYSLFEAINDAPNACDQALKAIVANSSKNLYMVTTDTPKVVYEAHLRASQLEFGKSCDDLVGRLLATLCCNIANNGRILEIGTGAGVGTAWISTTISDSVQLISIEADPLIGQELIRLVWPQNIHILLGDACDLLPSLGSFHVIFADASPMKYDNIDLILKALHPGGFLVIDDTRIGPSMTSESNRKIACLKARLFSDSSLQVVDLDWSTGILLITKLKRNDSHGVEN